MRGRMMLGISYLRELAAHVPPGTGPSSFVPTSLNVSSRRLLRDFTLSSVGPCEAPKRKFWGVAGVPSLRMVYHLYTNSVNVPPFSGSPASITPFDLIFNKKTIPALGNSSQFTFI